MDRALVIMEAAGAATVLASVAVLPSALRRRLPTTSFTAAGALTWGLGLLVSPPSPAGAGGQLPTVDTGWSSAAAVLVAIGVLLMLRRLRSLLDGARLVSEATMIAVAVPLLVHVLLEATGRSNEWLTVPTVVPALALGLLVAVATRRSDASVAVAAVGALMILVADLIAALVGGDTGALAHAVVTAAGWLLLLGGLTLAGRKVTNGPRSVLQMRPNTLSVSLALATITAAIIVVAVSGIEVDHLTGVLAVTFVIAFWAQEIIHGVQQKALLGRLSEQAGTDPLTGLGNRRALARGLARLHGRPGPVCVLTVDLDNFKSINTLLGHQVGDELLVGVAAAMRSECAGAGAEVFRLGGDEFAVAVQATTDDALALGERLIERVAQAARAIPGAARVDVTASVGVDCVGEGGAAGDDRGEDVGVGTGGGTGVGTGDGVADGVSAQARGLQQLTRSGDAMRAAKTAGRARVLTYGGSVARQQHRHEALERRLRRAIAQNSIELHLQPIISLPEMRMVGMESLARWNDEELGPVPPTEFIAVAEDCGLIIELGMQLTRKSMELMISTGGHAAGLNGGVNVSPTQLRQPGFVAVMAQMLAETGVVPHQFALEVTESVRIEADDPAVAAIWELSELGMPVAIDDFGTGYASLSLIDTLPAKILKLDRSIILKLDDPRGLAIARCVSEMARSLEVDVVAEGIETEAQLDVVRTLGVGFGQGWLFSKAVTPERFTDFVRDPDLVIPASVSRPPVSRSVSQSASQPVSSGAMSPSVPSPRA